MEGLARKSSLQNVLGFSFLPLFPEGHILNNLQKKSMHVNKIFFK